MDAFNFALRQKYFRCLLPLSSALLLFALHSAVWADGNHGDVLPAGGGLNQLTHRGFRFQLLTSTAPIRAGEKTKIILKVQRLDTSEPVKNGVVLIATSLNESSKPSGNGQQAQIQWVKAFEDVWAGNYAIDYLPERDGDYLVKINLLKLADIDFNPPEFLELHLNVASAKTWLSFFPWLLTALSIAGGGMLWIGARARFTRSGADPFNLLQLTSLRRIVLSRRFPVVLQAPVLAVTVVLALLGLFDTSDGAKNLATRLTWIIWWPGIILTFILFGRFWCVVCPFGALNEQSANLTRSKRRLPRALRGIWLSTLLFLLLTWADEQLGIIRSPRITAALVIMLALVAVGTGLFFQRRSFCRYLCPITGLQGLYSMLSPIELRTADLDRCHEDCRQACYRGSIADNGCPMFEFPAMLDRNTYCNFCFECVKACPKDNWILRLRTFGKDLWTSSRHSMGEAYLAFVLVGVTTVVTAQMLPIWTPFIATLSKTIPLSLRTTMRPVTYLTLTETIVFFAVSVIAVPLLGLAAATIAARMAPNLQNKAKQIWIAFAYAFIPIGLAMHLAHNFSHLLLEGTSVIPAVQRALNPLSPVSLGEPVWKISPLASPEIVSFLQMVFVLVGLVVSMMAGYRLASKYGETAQISGKVLLPFVILSLCLTLLNLYLLNQPMGARYSM